jgi:RNA polymerase sigma-70 factor, ECF subfamily
MLDKREIKLTAEQSKFFGEVYKQNYANTLNYISFKVRDLLLAEEIASDVFLKAMAYIPTFNGEMSKASTWLRNITNTTIVDSMRGEKGNNYYKSVAVSEFVNEEGQETFSFFAPEKADQLTETNEFQSRIASAFRQLKPKYRKVAILFFLRDNEYNDIAEICEIPIGSVKGMISRVRATLQTELKGEMAHLMS